MTWIGWVVTVTLGVWGGCFLLVLPVFLVVDLRNNRAHGNTGTWGYVHTLARVPVLAVGAPIFLVLLVAYATGVWRE